MKLFVKYALTGKEMRCFKRMSNTDVSKLMCSGEQRYTHTHTHTHTHNSINTDVVLTSQLNFAGDVLL